MDLESRLEQLVAENRSLYESKVLAEQVSRDASTDRETHTSTIRQATDAVAERDVRIREKDELIIELRETLERLQNEVARLAQENAHLTEQNQGIADGANERAVQLQTEHASTHTEWQSSLVALAALREQHEVMSSGMEQIVRDEIEKATADQDREIERLNRELETAMEQVRALQQQILATNASDSFLDLHDEDYFDNACQQLCQYVQQWVLRFSKFSDTKACRLSSEVKDDRIETRLDDAILDGSDVDMLLADRIKRRDVFMSLVMSIIWEHVFTRYLFGMDQEQRQKLKSLQKTLTEVGECGRFPPKNAPC